MPTPVQFGVRYPIYSDDPEMLKRTLRAIREKLPADQVDTVDVWLLPQSVILGGDNVLEAYQPIFPRKGDIAPPHVQQAAIVITGQQDVAEHRKHYPIMQTLNASIKVFSEGTQAHAEAIMKKIEKQSTKFWKRYAKKGKTPTYKALAALAKKEQKALAKLPMQPPAMPPQTQEYGSKLLQLMATSSQPGSEHPLLNAADVFTQLQADLFNVETGKGLTDPISFSLMMPADPDNLQ